MRLHAANFESRTRSRARHPRDNLAPSRAQPSLAQLPWRQCLPTTQSVGCPVCARGNENVRDSQCVSECFGRRGRGVRVHRGWRARLPRRQRDPSVIVGFLFGSIARRTLASSFRRSSRYFSRRSKLSAPTALRLTLERVVHEVLDAAHGGDGAHDDGERRKALVRLGVAGRGGDSGSAIARGRARAEKRAGNTSSTLGARRTGRRRANRLQRDSLAAAVRRDAGRRGGRTILSRL